MNSKGVVRRLMPRFLKMSLSSIEPEIRKGLEAELYKMQEKTLNIKNLNEPRNWLDFGDINVYFGLVENASMFFDNIYRSIRENELKAGDKVKAALLLKLSSTGFIAGDNEYCEQCIDGLIDFKKITVEQSKQLIENPLINFSGFIAKHLKNKNGCFERAQKNYTTFKNGVYIVADYVSSLLK